MTGRNVSQAFIDAAYGRTSDDDGLFLITLDYDPQQTPFRAVNNPVDIPSRGETFIAYPFKTELPDDNPDRIDGITLTIDNVDRQIVEAIRSAPGAVKVTLELVLASTPDVLEGGPYKPVLRQADYDALVVVGTLTFADILDAPFPARSMTPATAPGLF